MSGRTSCTFVSPECPVEATTYGYRPNLGADIFFAVVFGVMFTIALTVGGLMEMAGYIGRISMHDNPWSPQGFRLQVICLILAPSFIAAGIYWSLKHIVTFLGPEKSRLPPHLYPWIFVGCDVGSILLQAAGGGVASSADETSPGLRDTGNSIMIAGIAFQVVTMGVCGLLGIDFAWRLFHVVNLDPTAENEKISQKEARRFHIFCMGEIFAYVTVLIRCIYRIPEMAGGWGNPLMRKEADFLVLDGMMMALAVITLSVLHPYFTCPFVRR